MLVMLLARRVHVRLIALSSRAAPHNARARAVAGLTQFVDGAVSLRSCTALVAF